MSDVRKILTTFAQQSLLKFHTSVADFPATSAAFAGALANALGAIEMLLQAFVDARDELKSATTTIEAIRDLA